MSTVIDEKAVKASFDLWMVVISPLDPSTTSKFTRLQRDPQFQQACAIFNGSA